MQRVIPVPDEVPENFGPIIVVFSELESKGNTALCCHASDSILAALRQLPIEKRNRAIKEICSNISLMLLQFSMNPEEIKTRKI